MAGIDSPVPSPVGQIAAARTVAAVGDHGQESLRRLMSLEVGKAFAAQVLSRLPDGDFVVGIAGTVARMALPQGAGVGDQLSLTLIGKEPRPVFLLPQGEQPAAATLSPAARLIDSLMRTERGDAIAARTPLLATPSAAQHDAPALADAMRTAIEHSGLFYESHVAQWAAGQRPMEALLREPQMAAANARIDAAAMPALPVALDAVKADAVPTAAAPDAATLAAMQLDTLDARRVAWQGELFPGQPLRWDIAAEDERDARREGAPADGAEGRAWHSAIRIALPGLGAVEAKLSLRANRLQLHVDAADADAAAQMKTQSPALTLALEAAGIAVDQLTVRHGPA